MSDTSQRLILEGLNTPMIVIILRSPILLNSITCSLIRSRNKQVYTKKKYCAKRRKYPFHYIQQQSNKAGAMSVNFTGAHEINPIFKWDMCC